MAKRLQSPRRSSRTTSRRAAPMSEDLAIIAVLIAAINANQNITAAEGGRVMHLLWSMRRFRDRDGEELDRLIDDVRVRINEQGDEAVVAEAVRAIPARLRPAVFAAAVDLVLVDSTLERAEKQYLRRLADQLKIPADRARTIVQVMEKKNSL
ncbi:MAG TPA: tellurite resistance TerB family protein [Vicinamibacterales bacterium]